MKLNQDKKQGLQHPIVHKSCIILRIAIQRIICQNQYRRNDCQQLIGNALKFIFEILHPHTTVRAIRYGQTDVSTLNVEIVCLNVK